MGQLTNQYVSQSYQGLLNLEDANTGVTSTLQYVTDGIGNKLPMLASTSSIVISGSFYGDGSNLTGVTFDSGALVTTSSFNAFTSSMNSFTSSIDLRVDALEIETGSLQLQINEKLDTGSFNAYTSSNDARVDNLINATGSYATTSSLNTLSGSIATTDLAQNNRLDSIESVTGSLATTASLNSYLTTASFNTYTSSIDLELDTFLTTASFNSFTSSYYIDSGSFDQRIEGIIAGSGAYVSTLDFNSYTSSQAGVDSAQDGRLDSLELATGSYATTGSNTFTGIQQINNDLVVVGNLYVSGAEVIVSSSTLIVGDREIELNANRTVGNAGIIVYDVIAPENTGSLQWDATNDYWMAGVYGNESRIIRAVDTGSMSVASASYADYSVSSSQAQNAISSSYSQNADTAVSSSFATNSDTAVSSSYALNADNAVSSSHSINSDNSISSSYSDYAVTASYADFAATAGTTDSALRTTITAKNVSGSPIQKGTPCYITGSGTGGNLVGVWPADAGDPNRMPAGVVLNATLNDGDEGEAIVIGFINGVDTSAFNSGDNVYVAVGGGYTNQKPTGSALIQKLGNIEKVDPTNGSGVIVGPGRANDVPNILEGYLWVGNSDQVATPTATSSLSVATSVSSSQASNAISSSFALNSISSSFSDFATTASYALNVDIDSGSFATTGSNTFIGNQTIQTGSLLIAGNVHNSTTIGTDFIEDPNLNGGNLYIPRVRTNNAPMYVSSSHNIIMTDSNSTSPGNFTYLIPSSSVYDGRNIIASPVRFQTTGGQVPTDMRFHGNYFNGGPFGSQLFSFSTASFNQISTIEANVVAGSMSVNTPQSYRNHSLTGNYIGGNFTITQTAASSYNTVETTTPTFNNNNVNGSVTFLASSGSFGTVTNNNINGTSLNIVQQVTPNSSQQRLDFEGNNIGGIFTNFFLSQNNATNTTTEVNYNIIQGSSNTIRSADPTVPSGSLYNSLIVGSALIVSASHRNGGSTESSFVALGSFNEGGTLANTTQYKMVVGTGTASANRKTAFAISGSGLVENRLGARVYGGTLEVSGSAILSNDVLQFNGYSSGGANNYQTIGLEDGDTILIRNFNSNASSNIRLDSDETNQQGSVKLSSTGGAFGQDFTMLTSPGGDRRITYTGTFFEATSANFNILGLQTNAASALGGQIEFTGGGNFTSVGLDGSNTLLMRNFGSQSNSNIRLINDNTSGVGTFRTTVGGGAVNGNIDYNVYSGGTKTFSVEATTVQFVSASMDVGQVTTSGDVFVGGATGTLTMKRSHYQGNPFNATTGSNLGAIRYDGSNNQFSLTNYVVDEITTGSFIEMLTDSGNTNTQITLRTNFNNSETSLIVQNFNGYNGVTVNSDDFFVNSLTYLNANTVISGSLRGEVNPVTITSNTGSINFSEGNFFTMNPSANFHISGQNIAPGQTINVLIAPTGSGITATFEGNLKQPSGSEYVPTDGGLDIITLVSFDNSNAYVANVKNLI